MTTAVAADSQDVQDVQDVQDAEMEAAFAAASVPETQEHINEPAPVASEQQAEAKDEVTPEPEVKPEDKPAQPALSEDQQKLLAAIPKLEQLLQRVDKVDGHYGEIKRLLDSTQKAAATPKSAAEFEASGDADFLDREFQEIAQGVQEKIDRAMAKVPAGMNEEQLQAWYDKRKAADFQELVKILDTAHPDRIAIRDSAEFKEWIGAQPAYKQESFYKSEDPYYVSGVLSKFKDQRDKKSSSAEKSKQRIENAITPQGVKPKGPSTISDDEAAQAAFDAQFL